MPRKYHNEPVVIDGERFDSKAEARRWPELYFIARSGQIRNLVRQPRFDMVVAGKKVCRYVGDFGYDELMHGVYMPVVEDIKGVETPVFRIKAKLMHALYPHIQLRVIKS